MILSIGLVSLANLSLFRRTPSNMCAPRSVSASEVEAILDGCMDEYLKRVEDTFVEYSFGEAQNPLRSWLRTKPQEGLICMPGFVPSIGALAVKILNFAPGHLGGIVLLFDKGTTVAMLDVNAVTDYRTAGMSMVATRLMAPRFSRLGVYGSGAQARRHILMFAQCFKLEIVKVWNHRKESALKLIDELRQRGIEAEFCENPKDAAMEIIVTATNAAEPILKAEWLPKRCHINCVGAPQKTHRELETGIMRAAKVVVVDSKESALNESGDVISSGVPVEEIGRLIKENALGRYQSLEEGITIFKSLGIGVQDAATAKFVWDKLS